MKFLLLLVILWLLYRLVRTVVFVSVRSRRSTGPEDEPEPESAPKPAKRIGKDEGEYVDFEEVKD